jgi:hypothetical protein
MRKISVNYVYIQVADARSFQQLLNNKPTALGPGYLTAISTSGLMAIGQVQAWAAAHAGF